MEGKNKRELNYFYFKLLLSAVMIVPSAETARAQVNHLSELKAKFIQYRNKNLQEKLYVQTDKSFYIAGEILWFRIYDINGAGNKPFSFSKVAYVELLDKENNPVLQTKVFLDGKNGGSLDLPPALSTGNYILRAYTSWMKNFSAACYFQKEITLVNTIRGRAFPMPEDSVGYEIGFFPEGGNLVSGLQSEVAFKMEGKTGGDVGFSGRLLDHNGDTLLQFRPFKFGMGRFTFTPQKGQQYRAFVQLDDGTTIVKELPVAYDQGWVMHAGMLHNGRLRIAIRSAGVMQKKACLLIHTRGHIEAAEELIFSGDSAVFEINESRLGEGISQITLFDGEGRPVGERLYFKPVGDRLKVEVETDQHRYAGRQRVEVRINTKDNTDRGVMTDLAVSVYKTDELQAVDPGNILNYLWLSSELKGRISHPQYYFRPDEDSVRRAADDLMMTQGWRRFDWQKILEQPLAELPYAPEPDGPVISGYVRKKGGKDRAPGILAYLAFPGKQVRLYASRSNQEGAVFFNAKPFYGQQQIVVRTDTRTRDSLYEVGISNPFSEKYADVLRSAFPVTPHYAGLLQEHNLWMQVEQAYQVNRKDRRLQEPLDTAAFYGKPFNTYLLDNYTRYITMQEVLREYVKEVSVRRPGNRYRLMVMNALFDFDRRMAATFFQDDPLVLFDGVPVFDMDKIVAFDPLKVEKIEVVAGRYFYAPLVADGILSFTTYKGDMSNYPLNPEAIVLDYDGLQRQRIFYSPAYDKDTGEARIPDFRNTLYWAPSLETNARGAATCSFYTSDLRGKYVVVVNGITPDGHAGYGLANFETP